LERGVDIVVATPGRLMDLQNSGHLTLDQVGIWVLDEADRMLDMGFAPDIRRIGKKLPAKRQTWLFSATIPAQITQLATRFQKDAVRIDLAPPAPPPGQIKQQVMYLKKLDKLHLLTHLLQTMDVERGLVFARTKKGADRLSLLLQRAGVQAQPLHGDLTQAGRTAALQAFRDGQATILVATDVASRGLDVADVSHVFNYDLPHEPETYVHRVGRTGRAGKTGMAVTFCDETEGGLLRDIERLTNTPLTPIFTHPWHTHDVVPDRDATGAKMAKRSGRKGRRR